MRQDGLAPYMITCISVITACAKGEQPGKALQLLSEMRQHSLVPNVIAYISVTTACSQGEQPGMALELLSGI